ncbi:hypothetical protein LEN26_002645 [Aphanomyces euteiches]|nr:hypothetical protein AeMF1_007211 [Aphanomyces euteiches]KAH9158912.1 hypothetical protein LEN26_002645 [Aphanomyces euteiches]KAH9183829.1 hypothetical protein AeNC1_014195 [Aphanomyces euteiches]
MAIGMAKSEGQGPWTREEHERFLAASKLYPFGPWKTIAAHVRTRNVRQTQTHAQKYKEKLARWDRGLCRRRKIDEEDGLRPKFIEPLPKKTKKKSTGSKAAKPAPPAAIAPPVTLAELEPLAFATDCKVVEMIAIGGTSPCQVDALPSLGESLDYFMEVFEM